MNHNGKQINHIQNYEEAKMRTHCMTDGDPWTAKQHHWKSEAKDDSLAPVDQATDERAPVQTN